MSGWAELVAAGVMFLATHLVPARLGVRRRIVAHVGERPYVLVYSVVSLAALAWLIRASGRAPFVPLWDWAPWQTWIPIVVMPLVCLLAVFGLGARNPLSLGGRSNAGFDPREPGVVGVTRHPLLWAIMLWGVAHIIPNGDLAHVLLFGTFALSSLAAIVSIDRRQQRRLGIPEWRRLAGRTSLVPLGALLSGRWRPKTVHLDAGRLAAAIALYLALLLLHGQMIGVSPLPVPLAEPPTCSPASPRVRVAGKTAVRFVNIDRFVLAMLRPASERRAVLMLQSRTVRLACRS